jgi:hypothetical protein
MNDYIILMIIFTLSIFIIVELSILFKLKRTLLKDRTQYRFCQVRRDLIKMVHEGKLPVDSFAFSVLYAGCSNIIHYVDDYQFDSAEFIKAFSNRQSSSDLQQIEKLIKEIESYDKEVQAVAGRFFVSIVKSLRENCLVLKVLIANVWFFNQFRKIILPIEKSIKIKKIEKFYLQTNLGGTALQGSKAFCF